MNMRVAYIIDELVVRSWVLGRLDVSNNTSELTRSTRLLLVQVVELGSLRNCLAVIHARLTHNALHSVLSGHTLDVNIQVELTHARKNGLLRVFVEVNAEGRVLASESSKSLRE